MSRKLIAILLSIALAVSVLAIPGPGGVQKAYALTNQWYPSGPYGGDITGFAVQGAAVYAATPDGVFKSADGGLAWQATGYDRASYGPATAIVSDSSAIYVGANGYVYRSADGGASWTRTALSYAVAVNRLATSGASLYAATQAGLYASQDSGASWTKLTVPAAAAAGVVGSGSELYISGGDVSDGLYRSTDGGATWTQELGAGYGLARLARTAGGEVYAAAGGYLYRRSGGSWPQVPGIGADTVMTVGDTVFVGSGSDLRFSSDGGATWSAPNAFFASDKTPVITDVVQTGAALLIGTRMGVYRSTDGGLTAAFTSAGITWGIPYGDMKMLALGAELYVGTTNGLYKSTDGGNTWRPFLATRSGVGALAATTAGTLVVGAGYTYKINTDGMGYQALASNAPRDLAKTPDGSLYAADYAGAKVAKSTDNGITWQAADAGLNTGVSNLFVSSGGDLYAYSSGGTLYKMSGTAWSQLPVTGMLDMAEAGSVLYALTAGGSYLYKSTDQGATWTANLPVGLSYSYLTGTNDHIVADSQGSLYVSGADSTGNGVMKSVNGGSSWFDFTTGLPQGVDVRSLYVAPGDKLFLKTSSGMYDPPVGSDNQPPTGSVTINSGASLTTNPNVTLTITASDNTGVSDMLISDDPSFAGAEWQAYSSYATYALTGAGGLKTVYVRLRDQNGNTADVSDGITYDRDPPAGSITINGGAAVTTSPSVTLTISGSDDVQVDGMMVSEDPGFAGAAWEPLAASKAFTLSAGAGTRTVYLMLRDTAGRVSPVYSGSIVVQSGSAPEKVVPDAGNQRNPNISGQKIIYRSNEAGTYDVYEYDPALKTARRLTTGEDAYNLRARGGLAAWEGGTIKVLNPGTGILTDTGHAGANPDTDGRWVAFDENGDIMLYDSQSGGVTQVTNTPGWESRAAVGSGYVAWVLTDNNTIWVYDIASRTAVQIYSNPAAGSVDYPRIRGDKVYWADTRTGTWQVYAYTLGQPADSEQAVGGADVPASDGFDVDESQQHLVYSDGSAVYLVDLAAGNRSLIYSGGGVTVAEPAVAGNYAAWRVGFSGSDVYYMALTPGGASQPFAANVTLSSNIAGSAGVEYAVSFEPAQDYAVGQNQVVITMPNQGLAAVNPAVIWTAGLTGVGIPAVDAANGTVTIPFSGALPKGTPAGVTVGGVTNQSGEGKASVRVEIRRFNAGTGAYETVETVLREVSYSRPDLAVAAVVARAMEIQVSGDRLHNYFIDPATARSAEKGNTISVRSNADSLTVVIKSDGDMKTAGGTTLPGFKATSTAPAAWTASDLGFGYSVSGPDAEGKWSAGTVFAALSTIGDSILTVNQPTGDTAKTVDVKFKVQGGMSVAPGTYANTVTILATPAYGM